MANNRTFDEYNPAVEWSRSAEADAVRISLPGFKREDIRVLVDNHGHLRTRGERHVAGNRWSRFQTDVDLPANCNADGIRAKFEDDRLTITLPKNTPSAPIPAPRRPHMAAPSQRLPPAVAEPAARPAAPRPLVPAAPPAPAPSVKPPAEPRPSMPRKQSAFVPALAPAPAPLAPVPSVKPPAEPRPSMPKNPYAPVPAPAPAPAPAPQVERPAATTKPAQSSLGAVQRPKEQEDKQRKREEEGKMAEDKKETVQEKKDTEQRQQEKAMLEEKEMAFANQPRPAFASQGLLANVAIAVVVLLGVTVHLWLSLRNATGGAGEHGHGPRAPGSR